MDEYIPADRPDLDRRIRGAKSRRPPRHLKTEGPTGIYTHSPGAGVPFKILSIVLGFFCSPWESSLWWLNLIGWGTATLIIVFAVTSVGMMLGVGNLILGNLMVILFALSGFLLFAPRNHK